MQFGPHTVRRLHDGPVRAVRCCRPEHQVGPLRGRQPTHTIYHAVRVGHRNHVEDIGP